MLRYIVIALLYFWAFANVEESLLSIGLYIAIPSAFILSFWCSEKNLFKDKYFTIFTLFLLWISFTWFTSYNYSVATKHLQRLLGVFMFSGAICNLITDKRNRQVLYFLYFFLFLIALNYARTHILNVQFNIQTDRLDDARLNANVLANYTFYATFALFMLGEISHRATAIKLFRLLFLIMIPTSFFIAILTASRQVLIVQIPLLSILLYIRYFRKQSIKIKAGFIIGTIITLIVSIDGLTEIYNNSFLKTRSEVKVRDDGRFKLLGEAIDIGLNNPIMGVGPGNFYLFSNKHLFSHCSYTEAFANDGIIGLFIYIFLITSFIITQIKNYRRNHCNIFLFYVTFGIIFAFYNFFYVFYSDIWLMSFFLLVAKDSEMSSNTIIAACRKK